MPWRIQREPPQHIDCARSGVVKRYFQLLMPPKILGADCSKEPFYSSGASASPARASNISALSFQTSVRMILPWRITKLSM